VNSKTHMAKFVDEIIPGLPADARGVLLVGTDFVDFSLIGLRLTGATFTSIPAFQAVAR
jgi:hypothetical protein